MTRLKELTDKCLAKLARKSEQPTYRFKVGTLYTPLNILRICRHKIDGTTTIEELKPGEVMLLVSASPNYVFKFLSEGGQVKKIIMGPEAFFRYFEEIVKQ